MSEELKPCPFCGGEAKTWRQGIIRFLMVSCSNDSCGVYFSRNGFTPDEWNTRAQHHAQNKGD